MLRTIAPTLACVLACVLVGYASVQSKDSKSSSTPGDSPVRLGNFSVSLTVKDLAASRAFYEKLGFKMVGGMPEQNWVILQNEDARIGLFQGMFEKNMLTFNPGWEGKRDGGKTDLTDFDDVRDLQRTLKQKGLTPSPAADESTSGPGYFMLADPDGNPILVDQHVPSPKKK